MTDTTSTALAADALAQSPESARDLSPLRATPVIPADAAGGNGQPFDRARYLRDFNTRSCEMVSLGQCDARLTVGEAIAFHVLGVVAGVVVGAAIVALSYQ